MKQVLPVLLGLAACTAPNLSDDAVPGGETADVDLHGPVGQWQWFDIPGAHCGFGQQTGIGVSVGSSDRLLIYLEGGGLCWDELSCEAKVPALPPLTTTSLTLASYFTSGFTRDTFEAILAGGGYSTGIFDRTLATNPFKDATLVYVPYCTGDVHTGTTKQFFSGAGTLAHWSGRENLDLYLDAMATSFPTLTRVTLSGSSAGGFGALFDYPRVKQVFGTTRVDLITDSGPIFAAGSPFLAQGYPKWNTNAVVPDDCPECVANYHELYGYYARKYPDARFAFLSHDEDLVISAGYLMPPYPVFYFAMKDFTQHTIEPNPNWRYFVSEGTAHTTVYNLAEPSIQRVHRCLISLLGTCVVWNPFNQIEVSRTVLADWLTQMESDDPAWANKTSINQ